jgi:muconate cycloisomerase
MEKLDHTVTGHPFAKGAVDMALYDIMGKSLNRPTYDLLGGRYRDSMPVPASIGITDANQAAETAAARVKLGFKVVKLKVGLDPKADIERVRAVREAVGKSIAIRIDANQGYTPDEAIRTIGKMEKYDLMLVEQPVPEWDLRGMCRVARAIETPVMADESVFSPQDAIRVVRAGAADIINIKIMKAGGIYNSKRIAAIAEAADLPCLLGGTVHGGICVAACSQIVASTKNVKYPSEGLSSGLLLADDVLKDPIKVENGMVAFNRKPGLGVEIDANKIEKYRVS